MELVNCKKCGRLFGSENGQDCCSKCRDNDDDAFKIVREYLYDHPRATVQEVSEETGVDEKKIIKLLKAERIEIVEDENALLSCERCGRSIKSGRYCDKCKNEFQKELSSAVKELKKEHSHNKDHGTIFHSSSIKKK